MRDGVMTSPIFVTVKMRVDGKECLADDGCDPANISIIVAGSIGTMMNIFKDAGGHNKVIHSGLDMRL